MSFEQVSGRLSELFAGAATANANTFAGRMERLKVTFDEAKETIGFALLPILEKLMTFMTVNVIPIVEKVSNAFSDKSGGLTGYILYLGQTISNVFTPIWNGLVKAFGYVKDAIGDNMDSFLAFGKLIADYVAPVIGTVLGKALQGVGIIAGGVIDIVGNIVGVITSAITGAISAINWLLSKYNSIPILPNVPLIPVSSAPTVNIPKSSSGTGTPAIPSVPTITAPTVTGSSAGTASVASSANNGGFINQANQAAVYAMDQARVDSVIAAANAKAAVTVNMGVVGDPEAAARTITTVLNNSFYRGTGGAGALVT
jgi:hypothetical protein